MKGHFDKIYIATEDMDFGNTANCDFNIILSEPPQVLIYKTYFSERLVREMLEKLKVVCGKSAMRYVEKQLNLIVGEQSAKTYIG